jgi:hypothetical protein
MLAQCWRLADYADRRHELLIGPSCPSNELTGRETAGQYIGDIHQKNQELPWNPTMTTTGRCLCGRVEVRSPSTYYYFTPLLMHDVVGLGGH